jgi:hypothetical protein
MATAQHHPPRYVLLVTLAAVTVMSAEPSTAKPIRGCERPYVPTSLHVLPLGQMRVRVGAR